MWKEKRKDGRGGRAWKKRVEKSGKDKKKVDERNMGKVGEREKNRWKSERKEEDRRKTEVMRGMREGRQVKD